MKKIGLMLLFCSAILFATEDKALFAGMRNSRYAFIGGEYNHYGLTIENSIFVQKAEQQYVRATLSYRTPLPLHLNLCYALFSGVRYDRAYYDVGGKINLNGVWINDRMGLDATWQVYNDSEMGLFSTYEGRGSVRFLPEVSLFAGLRTIPEYRMREKRIFAGFSFTSGHLTVNPEVSTPMKKELELTRVAVSFLYKLPL